MFAEIRWQFYIQSLLIGLPRVGVGVGVFCFLFLFIFSFFFNLSSHIKVVRLENLLHMAHDCFLGVHYVSHHCCPKQLRALLV